MTQQVELNIGRDHQLAFKGDPKEWMKEELRRINRSENLPDNSQRAERLQTLLQEGRQQRNRLQLFLLIPQVLFLDLPVSVATATVLTITLAEHGIDKDSANWMGFLTLVALMYVSSAISYHVSDLIGQARQASFLRHNGQSIFNEIVQEHVASEERIKNTPHQLSLPTPTIQINRQSS